MTTRDDVKIQLLQLWSIQSNLLVMFRSICITALSVLTAAAFVLWPSKQWSTLNPDSWVLDFILFESLAFCSFLITRFWGQLQETRGEDVNYLRAHMFWAEHDQEIVEIHQVFDGLTEWMSSNDQERYRIRTNNSYILVGDGQPLHSLAYAATHPLMRKTTGWWSENAIRNRLLVIRIPGELPLVGPIGLHTKWAIAGAHWGRRDADRAIFKSAFESAGLPVFTPHRFPGHDRHRDVSAPAFSSGMQGLEPKPRPRRRDDDADQLRETLARRAGSARPAENAVPRKKQSCGAYSEPSRKIDR